MDFIVSKREFASVVKVPFERAFLISNIKAGFAKCSIYPFNPNVIDRGKLVPSLHYSSSSMNDSSASLDSLGPYSSDTSAASIPSPSSDESNIPSVNPSPLVNPGAHEQRGLL